MEFGTTIMRSHVAHCFRRSLTLGLIAISMTVAMVHGQTDKPQKLERLLLMPEPRELRTDISLTPQGAVSTVLSPAYEIAEYPGIRAYTEEELKKLGIGKETFAARAKVVADKLLATLQPHIAKNAEGKVIYAVYRGDRSVMACLLTAPSLPKVFESTFGPEQWVVTPDQHSLFIFPAKPEALADFSDDLADRYRSDAFSASPEVFVIKHGEEPKVIGSYAK